MIYLPEYHSRFAKVMCLVLVILISAMFYYKGEDKEMGYYEGAADTIEYIFFFEKRMLENWNSKSDSSKGLYEDSFESYLKNMTNGHRKKYLANKITSLLLFYMVIPYFFLGYLFTAVFHPIVLDPARKVIYSVLNFPTVSCSIFKIFPEIIF
jgi:hypothetical protein